eukprot:14420666-Alexandrium_andersonii.AAC.1
MHSTSSLATQGPHATCNLTCQAGVKDPGSLIPPACLASTPLRRLSRKGPRKNETHQRMECKDQGGVAQPRLKGLAGATSQARAARRTTQNGVQ